MTKCVARVLALLAVAVIFASCQSSLDLGESQKNDLPDAAKKLEKISSNFIVSIEENPADGLIWQVQIPVADRDFVELQGNGYEIRQGVRNFVFLCKKAGTGKITIIYKRAGSKGEVVSEKTLQVSYDGKKEPVWKFVAN